MLDIRIDRGSCMGSGNCAFWAPEVFEVADDGVAVVLDVEDARLEDVRRAVDGCPTQSISVWSDGVLLGG